MAVPYGFSKATILRLGDDLKPATSAEKVEINGVPREGATASFEITGLTKTPVKVFGSNIAYFLARKGYGDVAANLGLLDVPYELDHEMAGHKRSKDEGGIHLVGNDTEPPYYAILLESMDAYVLKDVTKKAKDIAQSSGYERENISHEQFGELPARIPLKASFSKRGKDARFKVKGQFHILYGKESIDITGLEQLVDTSQTECLAMMIDYYQQHLLNEQDTINQAADQLYDFIDEKGLDAISPHSGHPGNIALPRKQEFCAALTRYRGLKVKD
jgi:hypothetical protein